MRKTITPSNHFTASLPRIDQCRAESEGRYGSMVGFRVDLRAPVPAAISTAKSPYGPMMLWSKVTIAPSDQTC
jgi:hypothetical protein